MKAKELIRQGKKTLVAARDNFSWTGDERQQAIELLTHVLGADPDLDAEVTPAKARRFEALVARRAKGEPIPYIVGYTEFRNLKMQVRPGAFVPRATSEFMADEVIKRLRRRAHPVALDLATGIGPVALSIAHDVPHATVHAVDLAASAVAQARRNAKTLGLSNVSFYRGDLFAPLPASIKGTVDAITMHPPYVPKKDVRTLPQELRAFEPFESLTDGSSTGMRLVQRVADEGPTWLRRGGWVLIEIDVPGARQVRAILGKAGFRDVRSIVGRWSFSRLVVARL